MGRLQGVIWKNHQGQLYKNKATPPPSPLNLTTNTQECAAPPVQVYSESRALEINNISRHTVAHIEVQVTRTDDPMFVL